MTLEVPIKGKISGGPYSRLDAIKIILRRIRRHSHSVPEPYRFWIQKAELALHFLNYSTSGTSFYGKLKVSNHVGLKRCKDKVLGYINEVFGKIGFTT